MATRIQISNVTFVQNNEVTKVYKDAVQIGSIVEMYDDEDLNHTYRITADGYDMNFQHFSSLENAMAAVLTEAGNI